MRAFRAMRYAKAKIYECWNKWRLSVTIVFELKNLSTSWDTFQQESTSKKSPPYAPCSYWKSDGYVVLIKWYAVSYLPYCRKVMKIAFFGNKSRKVLKNRMIGFFLLAIPSFLQLIEYQWCQHIQITVDRSLHILFIDKFVVRWIQI